MDESLSRQQSLSGRRTTGDCIRNGDRALGEAQNYVIQQGPSSFWGESQSSFILSDVGAVQCTLSTKGNNMQTMPQWWTSNIFCPLSGYADNVSSLLILRRAIPPLPIMSEMHTIFLTGSRQQREIPRGQQLYPNSPSWTVIEKESIKWSQEVRQWQVKNTISRLSVYEQSICLS